VDDVPFEWLDYAEPVPFDNGALALDVSANEFANGAYAAGTVMQVANPRHLDNVRKHLDGSFKQVKDIDFAGSCGITNAIIKEKSAGRITISCSWGDLDSAATARFRSRAGGAHYGWTPKFESVDYNPYLADFYEDMERWSFNLQIYFLNKRFKDVVEISRTDDIIIQDRTIYEDARIFAPNLHAMGLMSTRDFESYSDLFELMMSLVSKPDLMIYLRSSIPNLVAQIQKRGREYERSIRIDYLTGLNERYENWVKEYDGRLLIIDVDRIKFENRPEDFQEVTDKIDAELFGLF
jgi:deoxyadenosine/deoxycytidine kinase